MFLASYIICQGWCGCCKLSTTGLWMRQSTPEISIQALIAAMLLESARHRSLYYEIPYSVFWSIMGTEDLVSRIMFFILFIPPLSDSHHKFRIIVGIRMPIKRPIWCQDLKLVLPPLKPHHVKTFFHRRWRRECGMANQFRYAFLLRRRWYYGICTCSAFTENYLL